MRRRIESATRHHPARYLRRSYVIFFRHRLQYDSLIFINAILIHLILSKYNTREVENRKLFRKNSMNVRRNTQTSFRQRITNISDAQDINTIKLYKSLSYARVYTENGSSTNKRYIFRSLKTYSDGREREEATTVFTVKDKAVRVGLAERRRIGRRANYAMNTFTGSCNDAVLLRII